MSSLGWTVLVILVLVGAAILFSKDGDNDDQGWR